MSQYSIQYDYSSKSKKQAANPHIASGMKGGMIRYHIGTAVWTQ